MACNPKEYDGKGGAIALTRWIEKMENVTDNSGCAENQKLKYASMNHKMVGVNHVGYTDRFHELAKLVPHLVTPKSSRIKRVGILTDEAVSCGTLTKGNDVAAIQSPATAPKTDAAVLYAKWGYLQRQHILH
nr:hypothetical protein [Tanacetum cinerariifolium]